jgi:hypothetical protein
MKECKSKGKDVKKKRGDEMSKRSNVKRKRRDASSK